MKKIYVRKKFWVSLAWVVLALFGLAAPAFAQTEEYSIHLRRNFGYGGGVNIRGTFTISLTGDESVVESVQFMIDDGVISEQRSTPFSFQFHTDDYGFGTHTLWAQIQLEDGTRVATKTVDYNFVSPAAEREQVGGILGGVGGALLVTLLIVGLVQGALLKGKRKAPHQPGTPRTYGALGGTVCPQCGRPFSRHWFGLNLLVGRLDRCDNCGKWVMTTRATPAVLQAAEEAENTAAATDAAVGDHLSEKDRSLDETRYIDEV